MNSALFLTGLTVLAVSTLALLCVTLLGPHWPLRGDDQK